MFKDYREVIQYLYDSLPMFQRVGAVAYKKDLTNTLALCQFLHQPQSKFPAIHVAGTNGKGSTSHLLAAVLQRAGYKTGLYTSPHLKEFTERIRVNGEEVTHAFVIDFVNRIKPAMEEIRPSFFEITVAMAFDYFARQQVDIAVIEVGLGGRLDSTNVIRPLVSIITNIGWDHKELLGDTLPKIAFEKAGIIKRDIPVIVSQRQPEVSLVFTEKAKQENAPLHFADEKYHAKITGDELVVLADGHEWLTIKPFPLAGLYQQKNVPGVLAVVDQLKQQGWNIPDGAIVSGFLDVVALTQLKGRWQQVGTRPNVFCDTGHNLDGIAEVVKMIERQTFNRLFMVIGMVKDKDVEEVLRLLPKNAHYFFCQAKIPRALQAERLYEKAQTIGLQGEVVADVNEALRRAKQQAAADDFIFVGGSTFVVAEVNEI